MKHSFSIKLLSIFLCIALIMTYLPLSVLAAETYDITDAYGTVLIEGTIKWDDNNNEDGFRPDSVVVALYANTEKIMEQTVTGPDWEYAFDISSGVPDGNGGYKSPIGMTFTVSHSAIDKYTTTNIVHPIVEFQDPAVTGGWDKTTPCSSLDITHEGVAGMSIVASKMTSDGIVIIWSEEPLAQFERTIVIDSLEKNANGLGNPKNYIFLSGEGAVSEYGITVTSTNVMYGNTKDWSIFFVGMYNRGYSNASESSITNTYVSEMITVQAEKVWHDDNNRDGIRPNSIQLQLYKTVNNNTNPIGSPVTVTAGTSWTHQFGELHKYENGELVQYTVKEVSVPDGYEDTVAVDTEHTGVIMVTNTHVPNKTAVSARKVWEDDNNRDNARPSALTFALYADGVKVTGSEKTVNAANNWSASWTDIYEKENGRVISYTVREETVLAGYTVSYEKEGNTCIITNTYIPEKINIPVTKVWDDGNNQDGIRPTEIVAELYKGNTKLDEITLSVENAWYGEFTDLYRFEGGTEIAYTVKEKSVPTGYTESISSNANGFVITNKHTPAVTSLSINKVWDDDNNQDGKRPDSITVHIMNGESHMGESYKKVLSEATGWAATWENLPKYTNGVENLYLVYEEIVDGYDVTYVRNSATSITITNTYEPEKTVVQALKVWDDNDNRDGIRPGSIQLQLYKNGTAHGSPVTVTASTSWTHQFRNLDKYEDGEVINYTIQEVNVPTGYEDSVSVDSTGVIIVKNTHIPEKTSISASKVWNDDNNRDGIRPTTVTFALYADGVKVAGSEKTVNAANNWSATWTDIYKNSNGTPVVYTVREENVPTGYAVSYSKNGDIFIITNTHTPERISVPVTKVWNDGNNQDGIRPDSIRVGLYKNESQDPIDTITLSIDGNWIGSFTNLYKFEGGREIVYSVKELSVPDGYTESINGFVITNTHTPAVTSLSINKVWSDDDNRDGLRPDSITVHIEKNGAHMGESYKKVLSAATDWTATWENLPKFSGGKENVYLVYEETVDGYDVGYVRNSATSITITNTHTPEKVSVPFTKVWDDGNNRDGLRPTEIVVQLYANGAAVEGKTITLNEANHWAGIWSDLNKNENGTAITYTVNEVTVPEGYTSRVEIGANGIHRITNTHTPATTNFTVSKEWVDENNNDGFRPSGVIVQLYANDIPVPDAVVELNEENDWTHTWDQAFNGSMYVYRNGVKITYTVKEIGYVQNNTEDGIPTGYTVSYVPDGDYASKVVNTHLSDKVSVTVEKKWNDDENKDSIRPESIKVILYKNSEAISDEVTLNEANGWKYTWTDLYKYLDGTEIVYTVEELPVDGYDVEYSAGTEDTTSEIILTIKNTQTTKFEALTVSKIWDDGNNADKIRPENISIQLYKNGTAYGSAIVLSEKNQWKQQIKLVVFENGQDIVWTIKEIAVPSGYEASYDQESLTVTNKHTPKVPEYPDSPQTGDNTNLHLWFALLFVSGGGILGTALYGRKRKEEAN